MEKFNSLIQLLDYFKDEDTCKNFLVQRLHGNTDRFNLNCHTLTCPHCNCKGIVYVTKRGYQCRHKHCGKKFTILTNTIFENTKISLRTWFAAIYLITSNRKGISSHQLARTLDVTQRTAWFLLHRIRESLKDRSCQIFSGHVEADETFVGGKNKNRHADKKVENSQGRSSKDKKPVVGIIQKQQVVYIERPHKVIPSKIVKEKVVLKPSRVIAKVVNDTEAVTLHTIVYSNVNNGSTIVTDAYKSYVGLETCYNHIRVKHTEGDYKTTGEHHTNTIEGYWTLLKRMYIGTHHYMSPKHLQRYCDELSYRYNSKETEDGHRFVNTLAISNSTRITYNQLIGKKVTLG